MMQDGAHDGASQIQIDLCYAYARVRIDHDRCPAADTEATNVFNSDRQVIAIERYVKVVIRRFQNGKLRNRRECHVDVGVVVSVDLRTAQGGDITRHADIQPKDTVRMHCHCSIGLIVSNTVFRTASSGMSKCAAHAFGSIRLAQPTG